ncbi:MOSC domain-containing protein [Algoriphagus namhaensis]
MNTELTIQALYIYPIKSLGGISLHEARVEERGFQYDRRWMLVDQNGLFMSQRKHPQMALLQVALGTEGLLVSDRGEMKDPLVIPFDAQEEKFLQVIIWDDEVLAQRVGDHFDQWFSERLGEPVHLVRMPESTHRKVDPRYAHQGESVSFADGMPYLIIGEESLNDLNNRLEQPVPMDRFRPNLVFSGGEPFVEDSWTFIQVGEVPMKVVKPCARCVLTTVDQQTGKSGKEPLKTLASYRTVGNKVLFGQNVLALESGKVKVGDSIQIG